jgi:hypothetical protein
MKLGNLYAHQNFSYSFRDAETQYVGKIEEDLYLAMNFYRKACDLEEYWGCRKLGAYILDDSTLGEKSEALAVLITSCNMKEHESCEILGQQYIKDHKPFEAARASLKACDEEESYMKMFLCTNLFYGLMAYSSDTTISASKIKADVATLGLELSLEGLADVFLKRFENFPPVMGFTPEEVISSLEEVEQINGDPMFSMKSIMKRVQEKLKNLEIYSGKIDGKFGPATDEALTMYSHM